MLPALPETELLWREGRRPQVPTQWLADPLSSCKAGPGFGFPASTSAPPTAADPSAPVCAPGASSSPAGWPSPGAGRAPTSSVASAEITPIAPAVNAITMGCSVARISSISLDREGSTSASSRGRRSSSRARREDVSSTEASLSSRLVTSASPDGAAADCWALGATALSSMACRRRQT
eukprot:7377066-Prymnesium_polylepis.3